MDAEKLAALLNGREYGSEISREEEAQAKSAGLVVAFGASDDLLEFRGAIHDEIGCYDGGAASVDRKGVIPDFEDTDRDDKDEMRDYFKREAGGVKVDACWEGEPGYSWIIKTSIPHHSFEIVEDGEPYCRGIVFAMANLPSASATQQGSALGTAHPGYGDMLPHQQRVVDEKVELDSRWKKLGAFFGSETFADLDEAEQSRLRQQFHAMTSYSAILGERIAAFAPA